MASNEDHEAFHDADDGEASIISVRDAHSTHS